VIRFTQYLEEAVRKGDTVRIKKQYCDSPAEAKLEYTVKELRGPRVLITPKVWKGRGIKPTESVQLKMIEKA
jgi:hypothetical protein